MDMTKNLYAILIKPVNERVSNGDIQDAIISQRYSNEKDAKASIRREIIDERQWQLEEYGDLDPFDVYLVGIEDGFYFCEHKRKITK